MHIKFSDAKRIRSKDLHYNIMPKVHHTVCLFKNLLRRKTLNVLITIGKKNEY